jgi:hypothetical protein
MRVFCIAFVLAACIGNPARADDFDGQDSSENTFRQCVAQSMQSTNNMVAFQIMQNACMKLYRESSMLSDASKGYYVCLLRSLRGVNNDYYVQMAAKACEKRR